MPTVGELVERLRVATAASQQPPKVGPVLVECDRGDERVLPKADERGGWRTQIIETRPEVLQRRQQERVERLMALGSLVSDQAQVFPLDKSDRNPAAHLCLGRAKRNDVVIVDNTISSLHAHFDVVGDTFQLSDQGSSNGTFVNTKKLERGERVLLVSGDCLRFGNRIVYFLTGERLQMFLGLRLVQQP